MPIVGRYSNHNMRQTRSSNRKIKEQIKTSQVIANDEIKRGSNKRASSRKVICKDIPSDSDESDTKTYESVIQSDSDEVDGNNGEFTAGNSTNTKSNETQNIFHVSNGICGDTTVINNENRVITPRKKKSTSKVESNNVTPPKQRKAVITDIFKSPFTPSSLLKKLNITSPKTESDKEEKVVQKKLFEDRNVYQNARKALHSTLPVRMPGREDQLLELRKFLMEHLNEKRSGTLYVSGPPGTGKTASLSIILNDPDIKLQLTQIYINCTSIKSSGSVFSRIAKELKIKVVGKTEKDHLHAIENYLTKSNNMILLVLDEIDQLESKKQSILYTIFEWPSKQSSKVILIGIANALDLTDRILPRLQVRCELKPKLMHFAPYTKQQIVAIFMERLKEAGVLHIFAPPALHMLAGKVAAISGDVRRALDIGRRVVELVEQNKKQDVLKSLENFEIDGVTPLEDKTVELGQVVNVLNNIYGTTNSLDNDDEDTLPLQQKIILCSLLLILKNSNNKDITIGKLHDIYRKVCSKQNIAAVDQAEFFGLCSLIETRGIIRVCGKKETRLYKVHLQWDQEEVTAVLKDKKLLSVILQDNVLSRRI